MTSSLCLTQQEHQELNFDKAMQTVSHSVKDVTRDERLFSIHVGCRQDNHSEAPLVKI